MSQSRAILRQQFVKSHNYQPEQLEFLANDMSMRQYFRIPQSERILMDAPFPENPAQFIAIAHHLKELGLRTPGILGHHIEQGFVLLEDFGDQTFSKILADTPQQEASLYEEAIRILKHLHQNGLERPVFVEDYNLEKLLAEVEVFMNWYWPAVENQTCYQKAKQDFLSAWRTVFLDLPDLPHRLVLRDYHVDNLMWLPTANTPLQQCGLLDFQDAVWGPVVYDFISLVEDARRDLSPDLQESLWQIFLEEVPSAQQADYRNAAILGAGRHVKVIGVFTRYALRQGKTKYLCHLPRLWNYLKASLQKPSLKPVHDWFETYLPLRNQGIPSV